MIVLDTHIWLWWTHDREKLSEKQNQTISENESDIIGVSAISCWEIAKLVQYGRLVLPCSLEEWFALALSYPGLAVCEIAPEIAIESTRLPGEFHRDPADELIVATARVYGCPLITQDRKILAYPHVQTII